MKLKQRLLIGFLSLVLLVAMILPVYANEISDQQNLLEELNQQQNRLSSSNKFC